MHDMLEVEDPELGRCELLRIKADSCGQQNKKNAIVSYLKARVAASYHLRIILTFMMKGHTRFSVDAGFGNNRTTLKKHDFASLKQLREVIELSKGAKAINFMTKPLYDFEQIHMKIRMFLIYIKLSKLK